MNRTTEEAEAFINDLDLDELGALVDVVTKVDRLAMKNGQPVFTSAEIDIIGRFADFSANEGEDLEDEEPDADETDDEPELTESEKAENDANLAAMAATSPTPVTPEVDAAAVNSDGS